MAGSLAYLRALLCRDGPDQMRRDAQDALEGLAPLSPYRAAMLHAAGAADLLEGDLDGADVNFARALHEATAAGLLPSGGFAQAKTQTVNLQLGWLAGNNQVGEVAAKHLGYFEEEKLNLAIQPGGPSIDGVAIVASGRHEIGQVSSSP